MSPGSESAGEPGRPRAYIASPLGFTESGRHYHENVYLPTLAAIVEPIDPWALTSPDEVALARAVGAETEMALEIGRRNLEAIHRADILIALLEGQEPDSGTVAEIGYAAGLGKRCYGLRSDMRQSGEPGVPVNLQVVTFIAASGGIIAQTLAELIAALERAAPPA